MTMALIIVSAVLALSLGINILMLRAAVKFTNMHARTDLALRKSKMRMVQLQEDAHELRRLLADAQAECEKWKMKAVEISINAQKESE